MNWNNEFSEAMHTEVYKYELMKLSFIELILKFMDDHKLSKTDLASKLNISKPAVSKILSGKENLSLKRIAKIAAILQLNINLLKVDDDYTLMPVDNRTLNLLKKNKILTGDNDSKLAEEINILLKNYINGNLTKLKP